MIKSLKKFVDGKVFQGIILFVIIFNCVIMGLETIKDLSPNALTVFAVINNVCLWIFILEIVVKLLAYGLDYFKDPWNWFDMFIVGISMVSGLPFMAAFRAVRVLRVLKSLKALRGTKLIGAVRHLQVIITAIFKSIPSISAPWEMTSLEQPAANFLSLNFFLMELASIPSMPVGRILAAAPISPVSSSTANNTFSI